MELCCVAVKMVAQKKIYLYAQKRFNSNAYNATVYSFILYFFHCFPIETIYA